MQRDVYTTRLLHLKGKRTVRINEVAVSAASLNKGDVFLLDMGLKIYLFNGSNANKFEKAKGKRSLTSVCVCERALAPDQGRAAVLAGCLAAWLWFVALSAVVHHPFACSCSACVSACQSSRCRHAPFPLLCLPLFIPRPFASVHPYSFARFA